MWTNGEMMGSRVAVAACNHRDLPPGKIPRRRVTSFEPGVRLRPIWRLRNLSTWARQRRSRRRTGKPDPVAGRARPQAQSGT